MDRGKRPTLKRLLFGRVRGRYRRQQVRVRMIAMGLLGILLLSILIGGISIAKHRAANKLAAERQAKERNITIGATGCILLHEPFLNYYQKEDGSYDFSDCFQYVASDYKALDYLTCEMEGSITDDTLNYSAFPSFRSPSVIIENLRDAGVDLQLVATNHTFDGSDYGFDYMLKAYDEAKIPMIGIVAEEGDQRFYVAEVDGIKIGYIDYTYGRADNFNTIEVPDSYAERINMFDEGDLESLYSRVTEDIAGMRAAGAQFLVANLHWGEEYETTQNSVQEEIAQKFCDLGIDALIGGHPHVVQPVDYLTSTNGDHEMFLVYSVGNTLSNQMIEYMGETMSTGHTEDGVLVTMDLHKDADENVTLTGVNLLPTWCHRVNVYDEEGEFSRAEFYILPLNDIDSLESETGIKDIRDAAQASYNRTMEIMGPGLEKAQKALRTVETEEAALK